VLRIEPLIAAGVALIALCAVPLSEARDALRVPIEASGAVAMAEAEGAYVRGDYELAARVLRSLVEVDQQNAFAWVRLGRALRQRGEYEDAWRAFDRAIELVEIFPDDRDARAIELEARRGRAAVSIDAALSDVEALQRLVPEARDVRELEARLLAARSGVPPPASALRPVSRRRATGMVSNARTTVPAGVEVIQGRPNRRKQ
jgi:tetratricopeptide (TPR) repeat protein